MPKDIIQYRHKETDIRVRRYWNRTQLLFNETEADIWHGIIEHTYALQGKIGKDFVLADFSPAGVGTDVRLIINGNVVSRKWKA